ncbi:MAG: hypothetical protein HWD59_15130 [Coxiellaceae bacterium]|nr:MAG: hypothetical protein HWD59_15130 [Coxiellaceae bacterium]
MSVDLVVSLTIFTFQVSQVYNWYLLVKQQKAVIVSLDNLAYLLFSIIVISVLVYNFWTGYSPSTLASWYQSINASLNMAVWLFAIICLARARSLSIILLTLGCLLIVSSALTTDCLFMFAMDKVATARSIHIIWVLGVIAMAIGFFYCLKNKEFKFCPSDSIQARCCSWLSITSLVIVVIGFCFLEFFNLELNLNIGSILWCVPIVLVFTMITSVLLGNWFSNMILLPVTHFLQRIEAFNLGQKIKEENSNAAMLYEFKVLGNFINSSFKNYLPNLREK